MGRTGICGLSTVSLCGRKQTDLCMQHMRMLGGPEARIHFTHLSKLSSTSLARSFEGFTATGSKSMAQAFTHNIGVLDLMKESSVPLEKVCLLDPKAEKELSVDDGDGRFEWFLFGVRHSLSFI